MNLPITSLLTLLLTISPLLAQEKNRPKPPLTPPKLSVPLTPTTPTTPTLPVTPVTPPPSESLAGPIVDPAQMVSAFFALLKKSSVDSAYASLTRGSRIAEKPEELRLLKTKTNEAIEVFGAIIDHDLVESKSVGTRLLRATYVSHGRTFPLRWRFYFYNPDGVWRLIDLRVDDKLNGIFDELEERREPDAKP